MCIWCWPNPTISSPHRDSILFGYDTGVISGIKEMTVRPSHPPAPNPLLTLHSSLGCNNSVTIKATVSTVSRPRTSLSSYLSSRPVLSSALFWPLQLVISWVVDGGPWRLPASPRVHTNIFIRLILACFIFSFGVALQTGATALPLFVAGRVFAGLGVGMVSCLVPMYQSECSPKWVRGAVVSVSSPSCYTPDIPLNHPSTVLPMGHHHRYLACCMRQ